MQSDYLFFEGIVPEATRSVRRIPAPIARPSRDPGHEAGAFLSSLFGVAQLSVKAYRGSALARRLPACLRFLRAENADEGCLKIRNDPALATATLNLVLLGVTGFFRDSAVFKHLEETVLPSILKRNARPRIWSAACSDGQELYSVAILLAEAKRLGDCILVGSDCRPEAISDAKEGRYQMTALHEMTDRLRRKYFAKTGISAVINTTIRDQASWVVANLLRSVEKGPWHLILWRNMAIYLESTAADEVWKQLCDQLEPGGFLIGGRADHPPQWLPLERVGPCTYQKTGS